MAGVKRIEMQDHDGNIIHPHTEACIVFMSDGTPVESELTESLTEEDIRNIFSRH